MHVLINIYRCNKNRFHDLRPLPVCFLLNYVLFWNCFDFLEQRKSTVDLCMLERLTIFMVFDI